MRLRRFLVRRLAWQLVVLWLVLTATYVLFALIPDISFCIGCPVITAIEEPYLAWLVDVVTLDLGTTREGEPVLGLLADAAPATLAYLLPSLVLAALLGLLGGLYRSVADGPPAWLVGGAVHLWVAVPTFLGGLLALRWLRTQAELALTYDPALGPYAGPNLPVVALAAAFTTLGLGAAQARYVHAETAEYVGMDFVKTLRAGGAPRRALARHLLRNAVAPLLSLVVTRTLSTLVLTVFVVEFVFGLPGLGDLTLSSIRVREDRVVVGMIVLTVVVAAAGDLFQDVASALLDPRVTEE